jgi:hypothetical protein
MQKPQSRQSADFSWPSLTIYIDRFITRLSSPFLFCYALRIHNSVDIVYGGGNGRDGIMRAVCLSECKKRIDVDIEHSLTFVKAAIIKKKNFISELQLAVDPEWSSKHHKEF